MFIKSKSNYIIKVSVNVGLILGCEKDEDAFIELREMDTQSMMKIKEISEKGEAAYMDYMKQILPSLIIDHNLYKDENKLMTKEEVADLVFSKLALTTKVISEYTDKTFQLSQQRTGDGN